MSRFKIELRVYFKYEIKGHLQVVNVAFVSGPRPSALKSTVRPFRRNKSVAQFNQSSDFYCLRSRRFAIWRMRENRYEKKICLNRLKTYSSFWYVPNNWAFHTNTGETRAQRVFESQNIQTVTTTFFNIMKIKPEFSKSGACWKLKKSLVESW